MSHGWEDREVLQEVWAGRVPTVFSLADCEDQEPCYLMLPRMSYLPLATEKVSKHFSSSSQPGEGEMWFSYGGTPLRWHLPIGLLYDLATVCPSQPASLPWQISVHRSEFPADQLLPGGREQMESVFMSSLKEADQLKHSGKVISQMQKKDHNQLWSGLSSDKFDQFWAINRKLMEGESDTFKHIPAKFYLTGLDQDSPVSPTIVQKLVNPGHTLEQMLVELGWEDARFEEKLDKEILILLFRCLVQGIEPDRTTPLLWLSRHLAHPDNFLHIVIDRS